MKNVFKVAGVAAALAVVGTSVYMMNNKQARTQVGKKMVKAMDGAEAMIAKKMNQFGNFIQTIFFDKFFKLFIVYLFWVTYESVY